MTVYMLGYCVLILLCEQVVKHLHNYFSVTAIIVTVLSVILTLSVEAFLTLRTLTPLGK